MIYRIHVAVDRLHFDVKVQLRFIACSFAEKHDAVYDQDIVCDPNTDESDHMPDVHTEAHDTHAHADVDVEPQKNEK